MDHRVSKDMISSGMTPSGQRSQSDLGRTQYGSAPSPDSLMDAYHSIYTKEKEETLDEGKIPAGLQAFLDKKKGKKDDEEDKKEKEKDMKEMYGGGGSSNTTTTTQKNTRGRSIKKPGLLQRMKNRTTATNAATSSLNQMNDVDLFDLVKGKLIDEGYDEQEAIKIMVNLSEDQLKEISEGIKTAIGIGAAMAAPYLLKKFVKPKTDKMLDTQRKTNKIGGDKRSGSDFQSGVNAIKDAKKKGGLMNQSTRDALNNPDFQ